MARTITVKPATISLETALPLNIATRRKVAAYARVSTTSDEQSSSFEAQCDYYKKYIQSRPDMEFVAVYADDGVTGTSTKHREGFNAMVKDALDGKIDLILTKSVSRFARNVVDGLSTIRELKAHGVEIFFEKENIWTFDGKGELLISIMASLSQEESRSISENVKWGHRKKFQTGRYSLTYSHFLGYDKGEDGTLVVNEEEAPVIREIYSDFLLGLSISAIARKLTDAHVPTPVGKEKWSASTIKSILQNEKYAGAALLQKTFTPDFLTKRTVKNRGELPQVYIEEDHDAIIDPEQFQLVQEILADREGRRRGSSIFTSKIRCGCCGSWYGSKVWHSTDPYRRVIWRCNKKYEGGARCGTPHVTEDEIRAAFVRAMNALISDKEFYLTELRTIASTLSDTSELEADRRSVEAQLSAAADAINDANTENARVALDQNEFRKRYDTLVGAYREAEARRQAVESQIEEKKARKEKIDRFIRQVEEQSELLTCFEPALWASMVESVTVGEDGNQTFLLTSGTEITV